MLCKIVTKVNLLCEAQSLNLRIPMTVFLQIEIYNLVNWSSNNDMQVNIEKTKYVFFAERQKLLKYITKCFFKSTL